MTDKNSILLALDEVLELDAGTLKGPEVLLDLAEWDSIAMISLIALADEQFHRALTADDIAAAETIDDLVQILSN